MKTEEFKQYRRKSISEMRPYVVGEVLEDIVSVSTADIVNGSPKEGDMIARNPKNHNDQWLVAKQYFEDNLEEIESSQSAPEEPREQEKESHVFLIHKEGNTTRLYKDGIKISPKEFTPIYGCKMTDEQKELLQIATANYLESIEPKPDTSQVEGMTAEEWIRKNYKEFVIHCNVTGRSIPFFAKMLEQYASQTKQVERREELIKFASYNFKEALRVDYDLIEIGKYVDEYLTQNK
jgi:hypothetical protein